MLCSAARCSILWVNILYKGKEITQLKSVKETIFVFHFCVILLAFLYPFTTSSDSADARGDPQCLFW